MYKDVTVRVALTIAGLSLPLFDVRELVEHLLASVSVFVRRERSDILVKQFDHGLLLTSLLRQVIEVLTLDHFQVVSLACDVHLEVVMDAVQIRFVSVQVRDVPGV